MSDHSGIEWTDATWDPVTGCTKVSPGCKNCFAERLAARLRAMGNARYRNGFAVTLHPDQLALPLRWRRPRRIFVNSMSDLFHEAVPEEYILRVFDAMAEAAWHTFQVLTKRRHRLAALAPTLRWPPNVWQGMSVENHRNTRRVAGLQTVPAAVRFLSIEPLLGAIPKLPLEGIHWVIVGGESGGRHRPMAAAWAQEIRDQCAGAGVAFFFKQWGGRTPKAGGESSTAARGTRRRPWTAGVSPGDPPGSRWPARAMDHLLFLSKDPAGLALWRGVTRIEASGQRRLL
jgi:protein gp37